ncbi:MULTISPECIES: hypothetical protein [unclassified Cryobacterium]|uniref:hypothetical protein n=1 Tax=unclassified Cryobacterium TaxID=2649013 RepID=UPI002AB4D10A|nr:MULTISPECIES: hypothetical protein [unclassified Cryobacterium]MDY7528463.1 hypothetical protein [Cryobacterium sp. 10C2]MDY7555792.1 hypothetical protein [Cryobacterium sp. 10C3]MEB0289183.1 hypothetical protein [Cryobacterium sp. 10C2]
MNRLQIVTSSVRNFWIDNLWFDVVIVVGVLGVHAALILWNPLFDILGSAAPTDRRAVYASAAIVVSLLGSFSAVAIGQLSSAKGARAEALRGHGAESLARNWRSIFRVGMLSALLALLALLLDPSAGSVSAVPVVVRWLFEAGLVLAITKFLRLSALFYEVITLASSSTADDENALAEAPVVDENWHKRVA